MSFPVPGGVSPGHRGGSSRSLIERSKADGLAGKGARGRLHSSSIKAEKMLVTRRKNEGSRPPSQVTGHRSQRGHAGKYRRCPREQHLGEQRQLPPQFKCPGGGAVVGLQALIRTLPRAWATVGPRVSPRPHAPSRGGLSPRGDPRRPPAGGLALPPCSVPALRRNRCHKVWAPEAKTRALSHTLKSRF